MSGQKMMSKTPRRWKTVRTVSVRLTVLLVHQLKMLSMGGQCRLHLVFGPQQRGEPMSGRRWFFQNAQYNRKQWSFATRFRGISW
jgi:hypothetical protein